jgi:hypothetical protein
MARPIYNKKQFILKFKMFSPKIFIKILNYNLLKIKKFGIKSNLILNNI